MDYRNDVQGIRAVAVLLVLFFHIDKSWVPGGFIGVDVFFVISGFLITSIILNKIEKRDFNLINFYISRAKRIVPAYYFAICVVVIGVLSFFIQSDILQFKASFFYSSIFLSNFYFASGDTYFGASLSEHPLLHTWTLAVEMQFYFLLPWLLIFLKRPWLKLVIPILILSILFFTEYSISNGRKDKMYFDLFTRSSEFLIGSLVAVLRINSKRNSNAIAALSFLSLLICAALLSQSSRFPGIVAIIPCIAAAGLLISNDSIINRRVLSHPLMVFIGEISYSIYLWHWIVLAFFRYETERYFLTPLHLFAAIVLTLLLSLLSYFLIEKTTKILSRRHFLTLSPILIVIHAVFYFRLANISTDKALERYASPAAIGLHTHSANYSNDSLRGDLTAKDTLLLIGDSHGLFMNVFFDSVCRKNGLVLRSVTNDSYVPVTGILEDMPERHKKTYNTLSKKVDSFLKTANIVILAQQFSTEPPHLHSAVNILLSKLDSSQKFFLISDIPILNYNPIRVNKGITRVKKQNYEHTITSPSEKLISVINKYKNAKFLDISKNFVVDGFPYYQDTSMYYDKAHLNVLGASIYYSKAGHLINFKELKTSTNGL